MKKLYLALCLVLCASTGFAANTQDNMKKFSSIASSVAAIVPGAGGVVAVVGTGLAKVVADNENEIVSHLLPAAVIGGVAGNVGIVDCNQFATVMIPWMVAGGIGAAAASVGYVITQWVKPQEGSLKKARAAK